MDSSRSERMKPLSIADYLDHLGRAPPRRRSRRGAGGRRRPPCRGTRRRAPGGGDRPARVSAQRIRSARGRDPLRIERDRGQCRSGRQRILTPFLDKQVVKRAADELCKAIARLAAAGSPGLMTIRGPERVLALLRPRIADLPVKIASVDDKRAEVVVEAGAPQVVTALRS